ncbi:MAG: zinc ribbon domain-containing protein [Anaerolineales bacterium]|nr:zinc ribbon domain-containing protein [Anaerolineales bacterium]
MPIYTYRCANCGTELDHRQGFSDPPLTLCPTCAQEQLVRVYKPIPVVFKGSGFYATDHRSPSGVGKNANGASKSAEGETKSTESESKSESKTESTSTESTKSESKASSPTTQTVS